MKGFVFFNARNSAGKTEITSLLTQYLLLPLRSGFGGFIAFFIVLIVSKFLGYITGAVGSWHIESSDFLLSCLGFILLFLIKFLENFKGDDD